MANASDEEFPVAVVGGEGDVGGGDGGDDVAMAVAGDAGNAGGVGGGDWGDDVAVAVAGGVGDAGGVGGGDGGDDVAVAMAGGAGDGGGVGGGDGGGAAAAAGGVDGAWAAMALIGDPVAHRLRELDNRRKELTAERRRVAKELVAENKKRDRAIERTRFLTDDDLQMIWARRAVAKAKAKAVAKPKAKGKAKAKAKADPAGPY